MQYFLLRCGLILPLFFLYACQGYDVRVNERVVYTPPPLFKQFDLPDAALRVCVQQVIADESITRASQLVALNCSHAGIENLDGLQVFSSLASLRLSANRIRNLLALSELQELQHLYLDSNRVIDPVPLNRLQKLQTLDLTANPALQCPESGAFSGVGKLSLPAHCTAGG
tara:strand:- start:7026 stop:7535 length:510 start_codon:yes stop_codon:yes gene_type:complete